MKVAIIAPLQFTVELCCKELYYQLKNDYKCNVKIICDTNNKNNLTNLKKKWNAQIIHVKTPRYFSIIKDIKYFFNLYKILKYQKFDAVFCVTTKPNIYGTIASYLAKVPIKTLSIWGMGRLWLINSNIKIVTLRFFLNILYKISFYFTDFIWITNYFDYKKLIIKNKSLKKKFINTKNYIDLKKYKPLRLTFYKKKNILKKYDINTNSKIVILVGRMIWSKGIKEFVEAANILDKKNKNIHFILLGHLEHGALDSVPKKYLDEANKKKNFSWLGFVKNVRELYAISDIVTLPSYYPEGGYPRAITEGMAMGKPIITTNLPQCKSTVDVGYNGYLIPAQNSRSFAKNILKILSNKNRLKRFGKHSLKKSKEFDEQVIINQFLQKIFLKFK